MHERQQMIVGENRYQLCFASNQLEATVLLVLSVFRPLVLTIYTLVRIPVQTQTETLIFWWNNISKINKLCSTQLYLVHLYGIWLFSNRTSYYLGQCWPRSLSPYGITRSRPNWIAGPGPKSEPAGKSESRGSENGVSRWRRPNSDIYSQNDHFGLVYDMIYQFLAMEAKNYKFGMFCQQCHPSVATGDADIRPRNASRIHTCHLFTS